MRVVTTASSTVSTMVEPIPKYRFAVMSIDCAGFDQVDGLVGDLGEDRVGRGDEQVDAEAAGDTGERGRHARERVAPHALERRRAQRDQHEVARRPRRCSR